MLEINKTHKGNGIELAILLDDESIDCVITSPPYYNSSHKYQRGTGFHYTADVGEIIEVMVIFRQLHQHQLLNQCIY